jgi:hypothetical protein
VLPFVIPAPAAPAPPPTRDHHPQAQVELASVQQQRVRQVALRHLQLGLHLAGPGGRGGQLHSLAGGGQLQALACREGGGQQRCERRTSAPSAGAAGWRPAPALA